MISFSPRAFRDPFRIGLGAARQIFERGENALQFGVEILLFLLRQLLERDLENVPIGARRDREFVIVIAQKKRAGVEVHLQFAALQDASVLIAQDREQDLVLQIGFERLPLDVEIGRVERAGPVFEHIHPPVIERLADAHVVRDEIEHLSHPVRVQLRDPRVVFRARTDRGIQLVVIGDVVAVQAFGARLKIRRRITIADPERVQIRHDLARLRKGELPVELQPVGRAGNARMYLLSGSKRPTSNEQFSDFTGANRTLS